MPKLIMMQGLPASGKSTRAKEIIKESGNSFRINRDELRKMLYNDLPWSGEREGIVIEVEKKIADILFHNGKNPIIDDTNLTPKTVAMWQDFAIRHGMKFEVEKMKTTLEECIERDYQRNGHEHVGEHVIMRMALFANVIKWPDKNFVICDIDGTLADCTHRLKYIKQSPKDYTSFYSSMEVILDKPNPFIVKWLEKLYDDGYGIIIVSGRSMDKAGEATTIWLDTNDVPYDFLFMRNAGDYREDSIIKTEILNHLPKDRIAFSIDDRMSVVRDCWRKNGIKCYPVSAGDGEF